MKKTVMEMVNAAVVALSIVSIAAPAWAIDGMRQFEEYKGVIENTAAMASDREAAALAERYGLRILDLTWEDTGRYKNSSVGPNISDMTIQIQQKDPKSGTYRLTCMPVIRHPNFSDRTGDISPDKFYLLVGNEKGEGLKRVTLREFLEDVKEHLHDSASWKGNRSSLLAGRDMHALVSAQACFLPIPKEGIAEFNPVIFNYQSRENDPAVLTILATREGTSVTVIDNKRDGFNAGYSWGQRLFFNQNGERASLTGKRLSDFTGNSGWMDKTVQAAPDERQGLNMVLLIQVPLKQKQPMRFAYDYACTKGEVVMEKCKRGPSDVENAVIGHGKVEGPFTEIAGLDIERDPAFPIRVTVQFYKATSNGVVSEKDMAEIADQINKVYNKADYVGSLVVGGDTNRPTEYTGDKIQPKDWWEKFWKRHYDNTGQTKDEALNMFDRLFGRKERPAARPDSGPRWGLLDNSTDAK